MLITMIGLVCIVANVPTATAGRRHNTKARPHCPSANGRVVTADAQTVIFQEKETINIFGCSRKLRYSYYLGPALYGGGPSGSGGTYSITLAGPVIAYDFVENGVEQSSNEVRVLDSRTGRLIDSVPHEFPITSDEVGRGEVKSIVLKSDGAVAWTTYTVEKGPDKINVCPPAPEVCRGGPRTYEWETTYSAVHILDRSGNRLAASGADIEPNSLALAGSTLYWMEGGKPMSAVLN